MAERINDQNKKTNEFYLHEDRRKNVKQSFKTVSKLFIDYVNSETSICDVGCATGDFLWHLHKNLGVAADKLCGRDISEEFLQTARERMPGIDFIQYDLRQPWEYKQFDIVTCLGTLYLFDEFQNVIDNLISAVKDGGRLYIFGHFNNYGYKVKYEYSRMVDGIRTAYCDYAHDINEIKECIESKGFKFYCYPFEMSEKIARRDDNPLRVWTETLEDSHLLQIDGIDRVKNQFVLEIVK